MHTNSGCNERLFSIFNSIQTFIEALIISKVSLICNDVEIQRQLFTTYMQSKKMFKVKVLSEKQLHTEVKRFEIIVLHCQRVLRVYSTL